MLVLQPFTDYASLYLFPWHQTPEAYEQATGRTPPTYNRSLPPKYWEDPAAPERKTIVYPRALAINLQGNPARDEEGNPLIEPLGIARVQAVAVNIPSPNATLEDGPDTAAVAGPIRELRPNEKLEFGFGGGIHVRNLDYVEPSAPGSFTAADRVMLTAIARALTAIARALGIGVGVGVG
jgi:hypothetical protein